MQTTSTIMMVRPANFGFNEETAGNNAFQTKDNSLTINEIKEKAVAEFDSFVKILRGCSVDVIVMEDSVAPLKTDAVFPNNWFSTHEDGTMILYPMYSPNRRLERDENIIRALENDFKVVKKVHFDQFENENLFLEGTGSMILDRPNKICYACLSVRTDLVLLNRLCSVIGYKPVAFHAVDASDQYIYHTNVMMALGETFVVICLETVKNEDEKAALLHEFQVTQKEVIEISLAQMQRFAGNMLQVRNDKGETFLVMSQQAFESLTPEQIQLIEKHTRIVNADIKTIETYGGGSARCMMAEIFFEKR
jgi:hypothetical protein